MIEHEISAGVFVSFDGFHLKIHDTRNAQGRTIYLNPEATDRLCDFVADLRRTDDAHDHQLPGTD